MSVRHLLAAAALAAPALTHAQVALEPGHPDLTAPAAQSFEYEVRLAGETPRRLGTVTHTEAISGDRLVLTSRTVMPARGVDRADTTVVSWPGLAPIARAHHDAEEHLRLTFSNGRVGGRRVLGNLDERADAAIPDGAFSEGMDPLLARAVPLREGYTATYRVVDAYGDAPRSTLTVGAAEGGVWPVTLTTPGQPDVTFYVDGATRALVRSATSPRAGMTIETAAPVAATGAMLRPGDLDLAWMHDDAATYALMLVEPMQMAVGTSTTTRTVADGVVTVVTTIDVPQQGIRQSVTARADAATLAPISQTMAGTATADLAFTPASVTGTVQMAPGAAPTPVAVTLEAPVFDASAAAAIAASMPHEAGYTAQVAAYDPTQGLVTLSVAVKPAETLDGRATWPVEIVSPTGPVTYYVDQLTHRISKMRLSPQEGVVVEMIRQP